MTAWIKRFVNNLRSKKENQELLLKPFLSSYELRNSNFIGLKRTKNL